MTCCGATVVRWVPTHWHHPIGGSGMNLAVALRSCVCFTVRFFIYIYLDISIYMYNIFFSVSFCAGLLLLSFVLCSLSCDSVYIRFLSLRHSSHIISVLAHSHILFHLIACAADHHKPDLHAAFSEPEHGEEILQNAELLFRSLQRAGCRCFMTPTEFVTLREDDAFLILQIAEVYAMFRGTVSVYGPLYSPISV